MEDDIFHKVVLTCEPPKSLIKLLKLKNIYICKTQWRILCQVLGETKAINLGAGDGGRGAYRERHKRGSWFQGTGVGLESSLTRSLQDRCLGSRGYTSFRLVASECKFLSWKFHLQTTQGTYFTFIKLFALKLCCSRNEHTQDALKEWRHIKRTVLACGQFLNDFPLIDYRTSIADLHSTEMGKKLSWDQQLATWG